MYTKLTRTYRTMHPVLSELLKKPQLAQRSPEWFTARKRCITASEISSCLYRNRATCENYAKIFGLEDTFKYSDTKEINPYKGYKSYFKEKCKDYYGHLKRRDNSSTSHGKKYEDVATRMYRLLNNNVKIYDFGLCVHAEYPWLGASPDGITEDGVMLEIKCPFKRKVSDTVPLYYYSQVQLQMEVCNLDFCDYIECNIEEYPISDDKENKDPQLAPTRAGALETRIYDSTPSAFEEEFVDVFSGCIIEERSRHGGAPVYHYPDVSIVSLIQHSDWAKTFVDTDDTLFRRLDYKVKDHRIIRVNRDKEWFANVFPTLKKTSDDIREIQDDPELYNETIVTSNAREHHEMFKNVPCDL